MHVVILENNEQFIEQAKAAFEQVEGCQVCAVSGNGNVGVEYLARYQPEVAIVGLTLSGLDGFGVLNYIKTNLPDCMAFVLSNFYDEQIVNAAIERGAKYYFVKPVDVKNIVERVSEMFNKKSATYLSVPEARDRRRVSSIDEKISNIFITIGIPPHIKGYAYLREGIKMAVSDPNIINNITKQLYPRIGEKFSTSSSKVERAIRHAIEVAWNRGRVDAIGAVFGVRVYIGNERPTNSEFIALVAEKILLEDLV
jgi:two-component system response regulator (stage 0 sporulation protein A)